VLADAVAGRARIHSEANSQTREIRDRSGASIQRRIVTKESQTDPQSLAPHVAELDSDERAILDLSLRYGFSDERLAPMLQIDLDEVADRREAALSELGERAGVDADADRPALEQALREVPHDSWLGRELRDPTPESASTPGNGAPPAAAPDDPIASATPSRRMPWRAIAAVGGVAALVAAIVLLAGGGDGDQVASHGPAASRAAGSATLSASDPGTANPSGDGASHNGAQGHGSAHAGGGSATPVSLKPILGADPSHASIRLVAAGPPPRIALTLRPQAPQPGVYEVWLYDTVIRAEPVARISHGGGTARFTLPADASDYRYIDISEEKPGGFPGHSGRSVERVGLPTALAGIGIGG
jgi:hypothetical protein